MSRHERKPDDRRYRSIARDIRRNDAGPAGAIIALSVVNLVFGSLVVFCSTCCSPIIFLSGDALVPMHQLGVPASDVGAALVLVALVAIFFWGVGYIITGVAMLYLQNWARIFDILLATFGMLVGTLCVIFGVLVLVNGGGDSAMVGRAIAFLVPGVLVLTHSAVGYIILFHSSHVSDFH